MNSRQRRLTAPWAVCAGLAVALAVPACNRADSDGEETPAAPETSVTTPGDPVQELAAFAQSMPAGDTIGAEVVADALRRLAGAAAGAAGLPPTLAVDLRVQAEHVLLNADSREVAAAVRETLTQVADAVAAGMPGARADALRTAAQSVSPEAPLTAQGTALRDYLRAAAGALGSP